MRTIKYTLFVVASVFLLSACLSNNTGNYQHVYMTPTNQEFSGTKLTVIKNYDSGGSTVSSSEQVATLTAAWFEFKLNGQLIGTYNFAESDNSSFVIPHGTHVLEIYRSYQGVLTVGLKEKRFVESYEFTIAKGQEGFIVFEIRNSGINTGMSRPHLEGVDYRIVQSSYGPNF